MPGTIKDHTLVYTVVIAGFLTVFFDLQPNRVSRGLLLSGEWT